MKCSLGISNFLEEIPAAAAAAAAAVKSLQSCLTLSLVFPILLFSSISLH